MENFSYSKDKVYYYYGSVHAGQVIESDCDIVIIGNVNPGAEVYSKGNITICGRGNGMLFAGTDGNGDVKICAKTLNPSYISIGKIKAHGTSATSSDAFSCELAKVNDNTITIMNII